MSDTKKSGHRYLYANIRALCEEKGVSIAQLERQAGLGNGVIRKWETASPTVRTASAVANCLGVTVGDLLRERPSASTPPP